MFNKIKNIRVLFLSLLLLWSKLYCCTGIRLISKDKSATYARTLEFSRNIDSQVLFVPRKHNFIGDTPFTNISGLPWTSKYATVGINALKYKYFVDGINETGLAGGVFYFPDYAQYQEVTENEASNSIAAWQLLTWILTTCCNIKEIKEKLPKIKVSNALFPAWKATQPIHYIIHEPTGKSLVIEYVNGQLNFYNNPIGVITNSPGFDWHITNLRNYINLTALNVPKVKIDNITFAPLGQGSGMLGLPGDFTPPSRFIRAVAYSQSIDKPKDSTDGVSIAFHILNLFNIPKGIVKSRTSQTSNYTQWTSVSDLKNKNYYFNTYDNSQTFKVNLNILKKHNKVLSIPMKYKEVIYDLTSNLVESKTTK